MADSAIDSGLSRGGNSRRGSAASRIFDQLGTQTSRLANIGMNRAAQLVDDKRNEVVTKLDSVVEIVRELADTAEARIGGPIGSTVHRGGDAIETLSQRIQRSSLDGVIDDSRSIIARHPGLSIGAISLVGFIAGRIIKGGLAKTAPTPPPTRRRKPKEQMA